MVIESGTLARVNYVAHKNYMKIKIDPYDPIVNDLEPITNWTDWGKFEFCKYGYSVILWKDGSYSVIKNGDLMVRDF